MKSDETYSADDPVFGTYKSTLTERKFVLDASSGINEYKPVPNIIMDDDIILERILNKKYGGADARHILFNGILYSHVSLAVKKTFQSIVVIYDAMIIREWNTGTDKLNCYFERKDFISLKNEEMLLLEKYWNIMS